MKVETLSEKDINAIGHAFGYYEYAQGEKGLVSAYSSKDAVVSYINGYVEMVLQAGMLYTTGPKQEAFIAYKRSDEKISMKAAKKLIKGTFAGSTLGEVVRMLSILGSGGSSSVEKALKKKKQKYLFVGLVCVREEYQGQGYMRKALELAFAEGNRLGLPVVLDTDAKLKSDKYRHLGMELAGVHTCKNGSKLYELIKYPDPSA